MIVLLRYCLLLLALGCLLTTRAAATGDENWEGFGIPGVDGEVDAMVVDGNDIYIGGSFRNAAGMYVGGIARWNTIERRWYPLGDGVHPGVDGTVLTIAIRGEEIFIGGEFTAAGGIKASNIALFNTRTRTWSTWGSGAGRGTGGAVNAIVATGADVYAGGDFVVIGSTLATNIARWDGTRWSRLESGAVGVVNSLAMMGTDLYVGGLLTAAGTVNVSNIARWNGSAWSRVESGPNGPVHVLYRDGADLLIGGAFTRAGNIPANSIVRYTPTTSRWQTLGTGVAQIPAPTMGRVYAITKAGSDLFVGGDFQRAGTEDSIARHIARWNGSVWSAMRDSGDVRGKGVGSLMNGSSYVRALATLHGEVYLGGMFQQAYMQVKPPTIDHGVYFPYQAWHIVRWSPGARRWRSLGDAPNDVVTSFASRGDDLFMGGRFSSAGGVDVMNVARWSMASHGWEPVGTGIGGYQSTVRGIAVGDSGLFAAVRDDYTVFLSTQRGLPPPSSHVARWSDLSGTWTPVGSHMTQLDVSAIAVEGKDLFIGGYDSLKGGILRWTGTEWGVPGGGVDGRVYAIAADKNWVYAGGVFTKAGNVPVNNIARWNRSTGVWESLGAGTNDTVFTILIDHTVVYAGGRFDTAGAKPAGHIAAWDAIDKEWMALGSGVNNIVRALSMRNGILYVGGDFATAGNESMMHIASWNGEVWNGLGTGVNGSVVAVAAGDAGVFVAGPFDRSGTERAGGLALWNERPASISADQPLTGPAAELFCWPNPFSSRLMIRWTLPVTSRHGLLVAGAHTCSISIHDVFGRTVATLFDGESGAGSHTLEWNAEDQPAGIYFCRLEYNGVVRTRSLRLVK